MQKRDMQYMMRSWERDTQLSLGVDPSVAVTKASGDYIQLIRKGWVNARQVRGCWQRWGEDKNRYEWRQTEPSMNTRNWMLYGKLQAFQVFWNMKWEVEWRKIKGMRLSGKKWGHRGRWSGGCVPYKGAWTSFWEDKELLKR